MNYCIYKITNPNGFVYIGQSCNFARRIKSYKHCEKRQAIIYNSIRKYGYESHTFEVLHEGLTKSQANDIEITYIKSFKDQKISLNISDGGSLASKIRCKPVIQYDLNGKHIKDWEGISYITRELGFVGKTLSAALRSKSYYSNGFLWIFKKDYEEGERPYWKHKSKSTKPKKVYQYDKIGAFIKCWHSIEACAKYFGVTANTIKANIKGITVLTKGYNFTYTDMTPEPISLSKLKRKKIIMLDKDLNILEHFNNATDCAKKLGLSYKNINACLNDINKTYKNFKFKYDTEYYKN